MAKSECMLTTNDNPFDPFEQFDDWLRFDKEKEHNCCEVLARIMQLSDDMTEEEEDLERERAIDQIIKYDFLDIYNKATRKVDVEQ